MAIRPEINGAAGDVVKIYAAQGGKLEDVKKVYLESGGKLQLYWAKKGTKSNPYRVSTPEDLKRIADDPSGVYVLEKDIYFPCEEKTPHFILPPAVPFTGVLDGAGHAIGPSWYGAKPGSFNVGIQFSLDMSQEGCSGWFCSVNKGIITRLHMNCGDVTVRASEDSRYTGLLAGKNEGIIDQLALRVYDANGGGKTGCIAGWNTGTIQEVSAYYCGGISSKNGDYSGCITGVNDGLIRKAYGFPLGHLAGKGHAGGLVGKNGPAGILSDALCKYTGVTSGSDGWKYAEVYENEGIVERASTCKKVSKAEFLKQFGEEGWRFSTFEKGDYPEPNYKTVIY